ncbi:GNAT family N-acetyltransferase [Roseomonas sp. WA12]
MTEIALDWPAIALTPLGAGDVVRLHAWQNEPGLRDLTMGFRGPVAKETTAAWVRGLAEGNLRNRVVFGIRHDQALKGLAQLHSIDWVQRSAMLGLSIGDRADRGAGLGFAAASLLLDYAFAGLDLQRVALSVLHANAAATRLYDRLGFTREGVLRSAFFQAGRREDVVLYGLLRAEWQLSLPPEAARLVATSPEQGRVEASLT